MLAQDAASTPREEYIPFPEFDSKNYRDWVKRIRLYYEEHELNIEKVSAAETIKVIMALPCDIRNVPATSSSCATFERRTHPKRVGGQPSAKQPHTDTGRAAKARIPAIGERCKPFAEP